MLGKYILEGKKPVLETDLYKWGVWMEMADRQVKLTKLATLDGEIVISTVFLGLDHNFSGGKPLLFETMVFGGKHNQEMLRSTTWAKAEKAHEYMLGVVNEQ